MRDLLDASVWVPLSAPDHVHHARARQYWDREAGDELAFCGATAQALLRHFTSTHVMGPAPLDGGAAWRALEIWLAHPRVVWAEEPAGVNDLLGHWSKAMDLRTGQWSDAYLAAFSCASGCRMVAFERDFFDYPGIEFLHLAA